VQRFSDVLGLTAPRFLLVLLVLLGYGRTVELVSQAAVPLSLLPGPLH